MGFSFREWILEVSFLSFSFNLSHPLALPFLQMRQRFLWGFQMEVEPKGLHSLGCIFLRTGELPSQCKLEHIGLQVAYAVPFKWKQKLGSFAFFTYLGICLIHSDVVSYLTGHGTSYLVLFHLYVGK